MMTTLALVVPVALDDSALGFPLRAESAANGDTEFDRANAVGSERPASADEARIGLGAARVGPEGDAAASLRSCSMGRRRCACAIFSSPSSRWKRCSWRYPSS